MGAYILRRLLLIIPTLFGIMVLNFVIIQFAPGGPVEQILFEIEQGAAGGDATSRFTGSGDGTSGTTATAGASDTQGIYRGSQGLEQELKDELTRQFGLDRPMHERFVLMLWNYARFDFGESFFRSASVTDLIVEKMPVSISLESRPGSSSPPTRSPVSCSRSCCWCCSPAAATGNCSRCAD
jgi:microcin C transport system permease protein